MDRLTNHSSCQKTKMNDLSCGIRMWAQVFFCFVTMHTFVRQTDRQLTDRQKYLRITVRCITVKMHRFHTSTNKKEIF